MKGERRAKEQVWRWMAVWGDGVGALGARYSEELEGMEVQGGGPTTGGWGVGGRGWKKVVRVVECG